MKSSNTANIRFSAACLLILIAPVTPLAAQSLNPALHQPAADSNGIVAKTKTTPLDDAVLKEVPTFLSLEFPLRVRLVKLTLRNASRDWVDINFRYDPRVQESFTWQLPELAAATYYTADWAILAGNDQLLRGTFSFAFGPDAKPPSIEREIDETLLQLRYGDPNVRSVPPPPTQIIINQDPPQYDPPFTINLDGAAVIPPR